MVTLKYQRCVPCRVPKSPGKQQQQMASSSIVLHNPFAQPPTAACTLRPCKQLDEHLLELIRSQLTAFGTWSFFAADGSAPPAALTTVPLSVMHVLAGDAGPDIRLLPDANATDDSARAAFEAWHQDDLPAGRCIVVRYQTCDKELVLVPLWVKTGPKQPPTPVYWGFSVPANLLPLTARTLHASKMLVVFDIDETLLTASTVDSLQTRLRRVKAASDAKAAEVETAEAGGRAEEERLQQLQAELAVLQAEQDLLQTDFELLSFYRQDPECRGLLDGAYLQPSWVTCRTSRGVEVSRPVVELELGGRPVLLTRVHPDVRNTSLIIRPRAGWTTLRDYMAGLHDLGAVGVKKERWEVYICTTAEREYAWEAWRLLDPHATLFPHDQLSWRMLCVSSPQKKDLLNVLRKRDIDAAQAAGQVARCPSDLQYISDKERASRPPMSSPPPLAVVVDDRLDVWEEASRRAVLQVLPFHPHKEAAAMELGVDATPVLLHQAATASEAELERVMGTLKEMRSKIYQTIDLDIKPEVARLVSTGMSEQLQHSTETILGQLLVPVPPVPQLLAESAFPPPAALAGPDKDQDRASDLRIMLNDPTMGGSAAAAAAAPAGAGAGAAAAAAAAQQQQPGAAPSDPRKRRLAAAQAGDGAAAAAAAAGGGGGMNGAAASGSEGQQGSAERDQQQQQPAKKQKKEKKKGLLDGSALTELVAFLQQQPGQGGEAPGSTGSAVAPAAAGAAAAAAAAAAAGEVDDEILFMDSDMDDRSGGAQPPSSRAAAAAAAAAGGGSDSGGGQPQQPPQQQALSQMGGSFGGYSFAHHPSLAAGQLQHGMGPSAAAAAGGGSGPPSGNAGLPAGLQGMQLPGLVLLQGPPGLAGAPPPPFMQQLQPGAGMVLQQQQQQPRPRMMQRQRPEAMQQQWPGTQQQQPGMMYQQGMQVGYNLMQQPPAPGSRFGNAGMIPGLQQQQQQPAPHNGNANEAGFGRRPAGMQQQQQQAPLWQQQQRLPQQDLQADNGPLGQQPPPPPRPQQQQQQGPQQQQPGQVGPQQQPQERQRKRGKKKKIGHAQPWQARQHQQQQQQAFPQQHQAGLYGQQQNINQQQQGPVQGQQQQWPQQGQQGQRHPRQRQPGQQLQGPPQG